VSPFILKDARSKKNGIFFSYVLGYITELVRNELHPGLFYGRKAVSATEF
jgi:hypothetical protein